MVGGRGPVRGVGDALGRGVGLRDGVADGEGDGDGVTLGLGLGVGVGVLTLVFRFRLRFGIVMFAFGGGVLKLKFASNPRFEFRLTF